MKRKTRIFIYAVLTIILFIIMMYWYLGGFNEPTITIKNIDSKIIYGKYFKGNVKDKEYETIFKKADSLHANKILKGKVAAIYYNNPQKDSGKIKTFIGILVKDSTQTLPSDYKKRVIKPRKVVEATLNTHLLIAPKIYDDIENFAKEKKIKLIDRKTLEIYPSMDSIIVQMPFKKN